MKKVVVTGIGAVTSIGDNDSDFWHGLISGKSGIKKRKSPREKIHL